MGIFSHDFKCAKDGKIQFLFKFIFIQLRGNQIRLLVLRAKTPKS